jgi:uncharacterized protein (TIGR03067 family)
MPETTQKLEGLWQMVRAELDGEEAPELVAQRTQLEFTTGEYVVSFDGQIIDCGLFTTEVTGDTMILTLYGKSGPNAGRIIPCIYQQVGERLRICYGLSGIAPPSFSTTGLRQSYLATYRRTQKITPSSPDPMAPTD